MNNVALYIDQNNNLKKSFAVSKEDKEMLLRLTEEDHDILVYYDTKILYILRDPNNKNVVFVAWLISDVFEDKIDRYVLIEKEASVLKEYLENKIDYKTFLSFSDSNKVFENVFNIVDEYKYANKNEINKIIETIKEGLFHK